MISSCVNEMTNPQRLRTYLERVRDFAGQLPTKYCYRNVYDFVLREGRFCEPQARPDLITAATRWRVFSKRVLDYDENRASVCE